MSTEQPAGSVSQSAGSPLRIAALVKQVPVAEELSLGDDGRLRREGTALEMNPYCRRAVSKGVELAQTTGGTCTVFTLGPPLAEDVLREAVAWGADRGVHLCDPAFAGSDTLATSRALAGALKREGPFDLVLVGRNSVDGDTGQVGPELAEILDLPFACGAREMELRPDSLRLRLEHDDGWQEVEVSLPAVVSVAERLCQPCKVDPEGRRQVSTDKLRRLSAQDVGDGPWGDDGSPTKVGAVRVHRQVRARRRLSGDVADQVEEAVHLLQERGALTPDFRAPEAAVVADELAEEAVRSQSSGFATPVGDTAPPWAMVVLEPGRPHVGAELLGSAQRLSSLVGGRVVAVSTDRRTSAPPASGTLCDELGGRGADHILALAGEPVPEDVAAYVATWATTHRPWVVLSPSTAFGREVAARVAASLGAGLVGDAIAVDVVDGRLVAAKPAFSGALVADITCTSEVQLVTVRPGVLRVPARRDRRAGLEHAELSPRGRLRINSSGRDDDIEVLAMADVVVGVGRGVRPEEYASLSSLAAILGAELAATRKVTDEGWAPRGRQVGITGRSISPRLYVALGLSGKFNHMVGVRAAGTVLAVNVDPEAPVFDYADVGILGDWHDVVPLLAEALRAGSVSARVADATP